MAQIDVSKLNVYAILNSNSILVSKLNAYVILNTFIPPPPSVVGTLAAIAEGPISDQALAGPSYMSGIVFVRLGAVASGAIATGPLSGPRYGSSALPSVTGKIVQIKVMA